MFDVAVIGGGPAGMSAAIGAACEGLETVMIADTLGGQAAGSSRIENFMGFPEGLTGVELRDKACLQVKKFGGIIQQAKVELLEPGSRSPFAIHLQGGGFIRARTVIIACGGEHSEPEWGKDAKKGVHYVCNKETVRHAGHESVAVVGAGNSAGQAVEFLADQCAHVHMILRGEALEDRMSHYLWNRIKKRDNVTIHTHSNVQHLIPDEKGRVQAVKLDGGDMIAVTDVYVLIGSKPNCSFAAEGLVDLDERGFIETTPHFETKTPGLYAVGDVRADSIKRVANACGEGAACIQLVYRHLKG